MLGREAVALGMGCDVRDAERATLPDDQPEQAMTLRRIAESGTLLGRDPAGDEALDASLVGEDAERRVARTDERPDAVDDELQDGLDLEGARDRADGVAQCLDRGSIALRDGRGKIAHPGQPSKRASVDAPFGTPRRAEGPFIRS